MMLTYRLAECGVERIEAGRSTFIHQDSRQPAWREFEAWRASGREPEPAPARPAFPIASQPNKLWIIGAGGFGREVFGAAQTAIGSGAHWQVIGFLNDIVDSLDGFPEFPRIAAGTDYQPQEGDVFTCAIGEMPGRRVVCEKFRARGAKFVNLVQPMACISPSATLGEGVIVEAMTGIGAGAHIGDFSTVLSHANIGHDAQIGAYVAVSPFAAILGRTVIGDGATIGCHAVVLPDVKIGPGATIGAGSVVIKDVPAGATVFGVPAVRIK
jgi:sugar O-acyltransferase (sialic acid O-acetyltransferase NeuD family)